MKTKNEFFLLLCDIDSTLRSIDEPFGFAVKTEEEAKRFVKSNKGGYTNSYMKIKIVDSIDEI